MRRPPNNVCKLALENLTKNRHSPHLRLLVCLQQPQLNVQQALIPFQESVAKEKGMKLPLPHFNQPLHAAK
jgi:hypothetical protein